jgi:hypothetical protein
MGLLGVLWKNAPDSRLARREIAQQTEAHKDKKDPFARDAAKRAQARRERNA